MAIDQKIIDKYLDRYLSSTINLAQDPNTLNEGGSSVFDKIKQVVLINMLTDPNSIFWLSQLAANDLKRDVQNIKDKFDLLLSPQGIFGVASNTANTLDFDKLSSASVQINQLQTNPTASAVQEAKEKLDSFVRDELLKLSGTGNTKASILNIEETEASLSTEWEPLLAKKDKLFSVVENTSVTQIADDAIQSVAARIAKELFIIKDSMTNTTTLLENKQGALADNLTAAAATASEVLSIFYTNVVNPIGVSLNTPVVGSSDAVSSELRGQCSVVPPDFVATSSDGRVFLDKRVASATGTTAALSTNDKKAHLLAGSGAPYNLSSIASSNIILKLEVDGTIITHTVTPSTVSSNVGNNAAVTISELVAVFSSISTTTLVTAVSRTDTRPVAGALKGVARFGFATVSTKQSESFIRILEGTTPGLFTALNIEEGTRATGQTDIYFLTDSRVNGSSVTYGSKLPSTSASGEWPKFLFCNASTSLRRITTYTNSSIEVRPPLPPGLSFVQYIITNNPPGSFFYANTDLKKPATAAHPTGEVLAKGALSSQGGHWVDMGSGGELETSLIQDPMQPRSSRGGAGQSFGSAGWFHPEVKVLGETCSNARSRGSGGVCGPIRAKGLRGMTRAPLLIGNDGDLGKEIQFTDAEIRVPASLRKSKMNAYVIYLQDATLTSEQSAWSEISVGDYIKLESQDSGPTTSLASTNSTETLQYASGGGTTATRVLISYKILKLRYYKGHPNFSVRVLPFSVGNHKTSRGSGGVEQYLPTGSTSATAILTSMGIDPNIAQVETWYYGFDDDNPSTELMNGSSFGIIGGGPFDKLDGRFIRTKVFTDSNLTDSTQNFINSDIAPGDYILIWPSRSGTYNVTTAPDVSALMHLDDINNSLKVFEISAILNKNTLHLNTGYLEGAPQYYQNGPLNVSPYYGSGEAGQIPHRILEDSVKGYRSTVEQWTFSDLPQEKASTGHTYFIMKRGNSAGASDPFDYDHYYRFFSPQFDTSTYYDSGKSTITGFVDAGVEVGDILDLSSTTITTSRINPNAAASTYYDLIAHQSGSFSLQSSNLSAAQTHLKTKWKVKRIGDDNSIYCVRYSNGSSEETTNRKSHGSRAGTMPHGFDWFAHTLVFKVYRPNYNKYFFDKSATFLSDGVTSGMSLVITAGGNFGTYTIDSVINESLLTITGTFPAPESAGVDYYIPTNNVTLFAKDSDLLAAQVKVNDKIWIGGGNNNSIITQHVIGAVTSTTITIDTSNGNPPLGGTNFIDRPFAIVRGDGKTHQFTQDTQTENWSSFSDTSIGGSDGLSDTVTFQNSSTPVILKTSSLERTVIKEGGFGVFENYTKAAGDSCIVQEETSVGAYSVDYDSSAQKLRFNPSSASTWALFADMFTRRLYDGSKTFTAATHLGAELIIYPGTTNEHRTQITKIINANTIEFLDKIVCDTNETAPFGVSSVAYAIIPLGYPNVGMDVVVENHRSTIKKVQVVTDSDGNSKVAMLLSPTLPALTINKKEFFVLNKGESLYTSKIKATSILDNLGTAVANGFLSYKTSELLNKKISIDRPNGSTSYEIRNILDENTLSLSTRIPYFNNISWRIDLESAGFIKKFNANTSQNLSSVTAGDNLSIWTVDSASEILNIGASNVVNLNTRIPSGVSNYYAITRGGARYYGHFVIFKKLISDIYLEENLIALSLRLEEVVAQRGTDYTSASLVGSLTGTSSVATASDLSPESFTSFLKISSGSFSGLTTGTRILLQYYNTTTEKYTQYYTWIVKGSSNTECTVLLDIPVTNATNKIVAWQSSTGSATRAVESVYNLRVKMQNFLDIIENYNPPESENMKVAMKLLSDNELDRAIDILKSADITTFLSLTNTTASYAGNAQASAEGFIQGIYKE